MCRKKIKGHPANPGLTGKCMQGKHTAYIDVTRDTIKAVKARVPSGIWRHRTRNGSTCPSPGLLVPRPPLSTGQSLGGWRLELLRVVGMETNSIPVITAKPCCRYARKPRPLSLRWRLQPVCARRPTVHPSHACGPANSQSSFNI